MRKAWPLGSRVPCSLPQHLNTPSPPRLT
jgi:hypothetical protein